MPFTPYSPRKLESCSRPTSSSASSYLDDENKVVAIENWKTGFASRGGGFRVLAPDLTGFGKSDKPVIEGVYKQKGGMAPGADRQPKNIFEIVEYSDDACYFRLHSELDTTGCICGLWGIAQYKEAVAEFAARPK